MSHRKDQNLFTLSFHLRLLFILFEYNWHFAKELGITLLDHRDQYQFKTMSERCCSFILQSKKVGCLNNVVVVVIVGSSVHFLPLIFCSILHVCTSDIWPD